MRSLRLGRSASFCPLWGGPILEWMLVGRFPRLAPQLSSLHWLTFLRDSVAILNGLLFEMENQSKGWFSLCSLLSLVAPMPSCTVSAAVHLDGLFGAGALSQVSGLSDSVFLMENQLLILRVSVCLSRGVDGLSPRGHVFSSLFWH